MVVEALTTALIISIWTWSMASARVINLVKGNNLDKLPLWAFESRAYVTLTIINVFLLITQYGILIAVLFLFELKMALPLIALGIVASWFVDIALQIVLRYEMSKYFVSALLVAVTAISIAIIALQ